MKTRAQTIFSIVLIALLLVPTVGAAYVLKNNGTITINHGALYVDGVTVDQYIISLVGVGGGNFDQSLNTTDDVTFENVTISDSATLGGVTRTTWTQTEYSYIVYGVGSTYYAQNGTTGDIDYTGTTTTGGAFLQSLVTAVNANGGSIYLKCLVAVTDQDLSFAEGEDIIFVGTGRRGFFNNPAADFNTYVHSGIRFSNDKHMTNALGDYRHGYVEFRDLTLGFTGITSDHLIATDYTSYIFDNCLIAEWGNTFAAGDGIICPIGASPTPAGQKTIIRDCYFHLRSDNCVGIGAHYETLDVYSPHFSFNAVAQVGISLKGVGIQSVYSPALWFGAAANGCTAFELYNSAKYVGIYNVMGSHQAGGIAGPCSIFGTYPGTWTNTDINLVCLNINADTEWVQVAAATDLAMWENDDAQERVLILGEVEGKYVPSCKQIPFLTEPAALNIQNPNTSYVVFDTDLSTTINLDYMQHVRICGKAQGNEAGAGKGISIYDITDGEVLCEYTWTGNAVTEFEGAWTNVKQVGATQINIYVKGATATEDMDLWKIWLETR